MGRWFLRRGVVAAASLLAVVSMAAPARAIDDRVGPGSVRDSTGDVVDDAGNSVPDLQVDLIGATASYRAGQIEFTASVAQQPTNPPHVDPNWASNASFVAWGIDTNADDAPDYLMVWGVTSTSSTTGPPMSAFVTSLLRGPDFVQEVPCTASPAYSLTTYSVAFPSSCIGFPSSFKWGAAISYDTNPADPNAPVLSDTAPNDDAPMAGPLTKGSGYWMITSAGDVFSFGDAQNLGGAPTTAADIEPTPSGSGYWILASTGQVFPKGDASYEGNATVNFPTEKAVSLSATPTGKGYWIFTDKGRVITRGDAQFFGDMSTVVLNGAVLGSVATPTGQGYWMVASDGGIFSFGDAQFAGSMGGKPLNKPVMSMAPDPDGHGYWLVASDGGIFAFDAPFYGSMGSWHLNKPISGMVPGNGGYLMVAQDGGIFAFGNVPFHGSLGTNPPASPVVAVALLQ